MAKVFVALGQNVSAATENVQIYLKSIGANEVEVFVIEENEERIMPQILPSDELVRHKDGFLSIMDELFQLNNFSTGKTRLIAFLHKLYCTQKRRR
jgi:hypothetical protein